MKSKEAYLADNNLFKSLIILSIPTIITVILAQSAYIIDSLFVAIYDINNLGIITLAQPINMFGLIIPFTIIAGVAPLISRNLGAKNYQKARKYFMSALRIVLLITISYVLLCFIFNEVLFANILSIPLKMVPDAKPYIYPLLISQLFFTTVIIMEQVAVTQGENLKIMVVNIIAVMINIILNYIFLVKTDLGLFGVGLSTVIATMFKTLVYIYFYNKKNQLIYFVKGFLIDKDFYTSMTTSAFAAFGMSFLTLLAMLINNGAITKLLADPTPYLVVKSMVNILFSICTSFMIGIMQTTQSFLGYNFGAKNYKRVRDSALLGVGLSIFFATILSLLIILNKDFLGIIFNRNNNEQIFNIAIYTTAFSLYAMPITFLVTSLARSIKANKTLIYHQWITNGLTILLINIIIPLLGLYDFLPALLPLSQIIMLVLVIPSYIILFRKIHKLQNNL